MLMTGKIVMVAIGIKMLLKIMVMMMAVKMMKL